MRWAWLWSRSRPPGHRGWKVAAEFEGVRDRLLVGYELVVGLNGTGDSLNNSAFTKQSLIGTLERVGINTRNENLRTDNVAAGMVTATLPAFARQGTGIDVVTAALGDAKSLLGGTLLVGTDSEVCAVAQGQIAMGDFTASGNAEEITKGVPTNGQIANGAIVEREIDFDIAGLKTVHNSLRNPGLTTARRMSGVINRRLGGPAARVADPGTVRLKVRRAIPAGWSAS